MKITQSQLKTLLREALKLKEQDSNGTALSSPITSMEESPATASGMGGDVSEVEAEVWGGNSPRADRIFVNFVLPKHEIDNMTTEGLEQLCIEKFYEDNGYGDDPFCNSLTVDGVDVQDFKDQMHLYQEELYEEVTPEQKEAAARELIQDYKRARAARSERDIRVIFSRAKMYGIDPGWIKLNAGY